MLCHYLPSPRLPRVATHCQVAPPSVVVLIYQVAGSDDGTAQTLGVPETLALTFAAAEFDGLMTL